MKENEDELSLFLEMRRRDKEKERNLLNVHNSDDSQLHPPPGSKPEIHLKANLLPVRRTRMDEFLNSQNDKNDYDWLLTPPGTPLFQSLEMDSQKTVTSQIENCNARPTALKSRLSNLEMEPTNSTTKCNVASKQPTLPSGRNSSGVGNRRTSSSGGSTEATSKPLIPTGLPSLPAIVKSSRTSTPTSRTTLTSIKPTAPPVRSSTPFNLTARSSTPTARSSAPASKSTSRSSTPTQKLSTSSNAPSISAPLGRSSSVSKAGPTLSKTSVPSRGSSQTVKSRPQKPSDMPGFSNEAPPNLKSSLHERPTSASRGRPGAASSRSSSIEAVSQGQVGQQSRSLSRGRVSSGNVYRNGSSVPKVSRPHSNGIDNVNPGLMGTQMVERVVNMRKLAPPKQDGHMSNNSVGGKSSSTTDSTGFGLSLSRKSLDMAMRHMDIRRSVSSSGSLRPLVTNIPASTMYSVKTGPTKSGAASASDSPLATSSSASSDLSVNNNSMGLDERDREENDLGSASPTSQSQI